jgi:glycogen operon protein
MIRLASLLLNRRFVSLKSSKLPGGGIAEFVDMIDAFHAAGLKIYLDVVFNHTAEGGNNPDPKQAKLLSWRALDNATYYQVGEDGGGFQDNTGCGANFNAANPIAAQAILDSLKYWRKLGVDGFRWDLAPITANKHDSGYEFHFDKMDASNVPNRAIAEVGARPETGGEGVDLIAESWGVGMGTYQLGNFPFTPISTPDLRSGTENFATRFDGLKINGASKVPRLQKWPRDLRVPRIFLPRA